MILQEIVSTALIKSNLNLRVEIVKIVRINAKLAKDKLILAKHAQILIEINIINVNASLDIIKKEIIVFVKNAPTNVELAVTQLMDAKDALIQIEKMPIIVNVK